MGITQDSIKREALVAAGAQGTYSTTYFPGGPPKGAVVLIKHDRLDVARMKNPYIEIRMLVSAFRRIPVHFLTRMMVGRLVVIPF